MRKIPQATYQSVEEVEHVIRLRQADAELLPPGPSRQSVLKEIAQLRAYADMKRWISTAATSKQTVRAR